MSMRTPSALPKSRFPLAIAIVAGCLLAANTPGAAADVAILDPALEWRCDPAAFHSKGRNTPWKGAPLVGRCTHAFVGGRLVHEIGRAR